MKTFIIKNWKTTLSGIAIGAIAAASYLGWITADQAVGITSVLTALGLIAAKDNNVTGGKVSQ
jgi:hypothetical protein